MNNRTRMRLSNKQAVYHLLKKFGWRDITLRTHCKHKDMVYNLGKNNMATDYWNHFDGMGFDGGGHLTFIQIKTNAWAAPKPIDDFCKQHMLRAVVINVKYKTEWKKWDVQVRKYPIE